MYTVTRHGLQVIRISRYVDGHSRKYIGMFRTFAAAYAFSKAMGRK